jgi:hypothetical protein
MRDANDTATLHRLGMNARRRALTHREMRTRWRILLDEFGAAAADGS